MDLLSGSKRSPCSLGFAWVQSGAKRGSRVNSGLGCLTWTRIVVAAVIGGRVGALWRSLGLLRFAWVL